MLFKTGQTPGEAERWRQERFPNQVVTLYSAVALFLGASSVSTFGLAATMGNSMVVGWTRPCGQASNEKVTLALPVAALSGTRTGP
jgi:hypothetical protein